MTSRTLRLLAALAAALMLLSACGGDDDGGDDATTTTEAPDEETTTTEAADDEPTETTETTEATTEDTTEEGAGTGSFDYDALAEVDDFCELEEFGESLDAAVLFDDTSGEPASPEAMAESYRAVAAFFTRANQIAPDEIKDDFALMSSAMTDLFSLLEEHDWDYLAMGEAALSDPELAARLEAMDNPEVATASENIDAWITANCG